MKLISGTQFVELIRNLSPDNQLRLLDTAFEGDYATPTCPRCDVKMVAREVKQGRNAGGRMWGCTNFPRCKQTFLLQRNLQSVAQQHDEAMY